MEKGEPSPTPAPDADAVALEGTDTAHGKANKGQHNAIFCAWLCRVFGHDYLRSRKGIADVAGGQVTGTISVIIRAFVLIFASCRGT